jgi:hypothetical protein
MYTGWDEKTFNRPGDLVSVAILATLNDSEMTSPETVRDVLTILRAAFACPRRRVIAIGDREPPDIDIFGGRETLLLGTDQLAPVRGSSSILRFYCSFVTRCSSFPATDSLLWRRFTYRMISTTTRPSPSPMGMTQARSNFDGLICGVLGVRPFD